MQGRCMHATTTGLESHLFRSSAHYLVAHVCLLFYTRYLSFCSMHKRSQTHMPQQLILQRMSKQKKGAHDEKLGWDLGTKLEEGLAG